MEAAGSLRDDNRGSLADERAGWREVTSAAARSTVLARGVTSATEVFDAAGEAVGSGAAAAVATLARSAAWVLRMFALATDTDG
jgi:hypothetical protein